MELETDGAGSQTGADQPATYEIRVSTEDRRDEAVVEIEADSKQAALQEAASYGAWEIGVEGEYKGGFKHFTVFSPSLEDAEEKLLERESDAARIIDNSQFKLGETDQVEFRRER